jgi:hypothetical protein
MAAQDRNVYDKSAAKPAAKADPPSMLDQLADALFGAGHGTKPDFVEGGKSVNKAVDEAVKGAPGNTTDY